MIPKLIHICWLSGDPFPKDFAKCISSWKKNLSGYEIWLWGKKPADCWGLNITEKSFDLNSVTWCKQAFEAKKYAFAADYIRQYAVYTFGGFYMDMDIEVVKDLEHLLSRKYVLGAETETGIEAGVFGAEKGSPLIKVCMDWYVDRHFINDDGSYNQITCPKVMYNSIHSLCNILITDKYDETGKTISLLPRDYLTAKSGDTGIVHKTKNTYTIHHFAGSWLEIPISSKILHKCKYYLSKVIGEKMVRFLANYLTKL